MDLLTALKALDPSIAAHWNVKGEPDLNALAEMTGHRWTRKDVKVFTPAFNRDNAAAAASEDPPETDDSGHGIHALCAAFAALKTHEIRQNSSLQQVVNAFNHHHPTMMELHNRNIVKGRV